MAAQSNTRARTLLTAFGGALIAATAALVIAGTYTAAFAPRGILDPGPLVRWGVSAATLASELSIAVVIGALTLAVFIIPGGGTPRRKHRTAGPDAALYRTTVAIAGWAGVAWTLSSLARLLFQGANTVGTPLTDPAFGDQWLVYLTQIPSGQSHLAITLIAAIITTITLFIPGPVLSMWLLVATLAPLTLLSLMGHAAGTDNHELAVSAMFLHLVGAALWIGALAAIAILILAAPSKEQWLTHTVRRYSAIAGWCFALVAVSGIVNSVVRLGGPDALTSTYGQLVIAKIVLFLVLGTLGALHRRRVVTQLTTKSRTIPALFWRLVAVELIVMGAVSGVSVALGASEPPVGETAPASPSPAYLLTGAELPPEPTVARYFTQWSLDVLFAVACAAGLWVYLSWVWRLRARGDAWPWLRTASWCTGMVLMFWITSGGPAVYGKILFSSHMLMHMLMAMVVPIFVALAAPVTLLMRAVPARTDNSRGPREWVLGIVHSRYGRFFSHPIVAAINFAGSMILFYYTPLFDLAITTHLGHILMVVHFSLVGYFFVNAVVGVDPGPNRPGYAQRLLLLLATMAFHAFFGVSLMASDALLVPDWFGNMGRAWGDPAIVDQQAGAGIAWGIGEVPTVALAITVAVLWGRSEDKIARRRDRQVDEYGDAELDDYNAMLQKMSERDARS
ncbi:cytochrome c oxidase assembly protein [Jonesia quinghaiensis]|uniref:cytochrome c oxidase assembly protein n=1 Tax=Jonesia quinghaiensis TaxID=262806 RepID=UPI0003F8818B|nr:cytochrome c oxidase assembly protein [Jonesia quinghaiensis]